jgi:hypothetical protein
VKLAALPPHSAERLCLSAGALIKLEAMPQAKEAQPPESKKSAGKAEPFRTVRGRAAKFTTANPISELETGNPKLETRNSELETGVYRE